ncbi:hypothetical protein A5482_014750 (plasmid) [Cyanobacterium sp. IPPAS B-1200]|uniref:hypothetical protein n=1 Tax=Cyanobacterium sp. IPPAS B-1200 TaxID=1562720 RepID=UPI0008524A06|nr:hypothetical protein [Cyanobacterium sp. IPPAS B-1200]OEJ78140.1 hypothetical protein A5482_13970 [Cyanobacterium sp. IPPAS B-1200]
MDKLHGTVTRKEVVTYIENLKDYVIEKYNDYSKGNEHNIDNIPYDFYYVDRLEIDKLEEFLMSLSDYEEDHCYAIYSSDYMSFDVEV